MEYIKIEKHIFYDPVIPLLSIYTRDIHRCSLGGIHRGVLFICTGICNGDR